MYPRASKSKQRKDTLILEGLSSRVLLNANVSALESIDSSFACDANLEGYTEPDLFYAENLSGSPVYDGYDDDYVLHNDASTLDETTTGDSYLESLTGLGTLGTSILYLDFSGGTVYSRTGDFWLGASSIQVPAYSLSNFGWDGREAESITYITQFVQEDYAAYDITVTTEQPTGGDYTTIYVGGGNEWFRPGSSVIGVATYDIGNRNPNNYGFAFSDELAIYHQYSGGSLINFSEYLANLISHEAAHTFGANHVDDTTALMNPYLPISPRTSMFGAAAVPGTNYTQDTQSLLGSNLGYKASSDDFGNSLSSAHTITLGQTIHGILERRDDMDAFTFTAPSSGQITASVTTSVFGNLDAVLQVYSHSQQAIVAQNDDYGSSLDPLINFSITAGQRYTVFVSSAFSDSLGTYSLAVSSPEPMPRLSVIDSSGDSEDRSINFGEIALNGSATAALTLRNTGTDTLIVSELFASGGFSLSHTSGSSYYDDLSIAPNSELRVLVTATAAQYGQQQGSITIKTNDPNQPIVTAALNATIVVPEPDIQLAGDAFSAANSHLNFGNLHVGQDGTQLLTIANTGTDTLIISGVGITEGFRIVSGFDGQILSVDPNEAITLTIATTPQRRGSLNGRLTLISNDLDERIVSVQLIGQGLAPVLTVTEQAQTPNDEKIDFGSLYVGESTNSTITITNTGDANLILTQLDLQGGFSAGGLFHRAGNDTLVLAPNESYTLTVTFQPDEEGDYAGVVSIATSDNQNCEINLYGSAKDGALDITEIDGDHDGYTNLGEMDINEGKAIDIYRLVNNSQTVITVQMAWDHGSHFAIEGGTTLTIQPGAEQIITLGLNTNLATQLSDVLTVTTAGPGATSFSIHVTADAYAAVSQGNAYSYPTQSGNWVTASMAGDAQAQLRLNADNTDIIESVVFTSGTYVNHFTISTRGPNPVQVKRVSGHLDMGQFNGRQVELLESLNWGGNINRLYVADTGSEAAIDVAGTIRLLQADTLDGKLLSAGSIGQLRCQNDLAMDVLITNGSLDRVRVIQGHLKGTISVMEGTIGNVIINNGSLLGSLNASGAIGQVLVRKGDITGSVASHTQIKRIAAKNIKDAEIFAFNGIDHLNVANEMLNTTVTIGETQTAANCADAVDTCLGAI